jgi:YNFM family putative membrane transporter
MVLAVAFAFILPRPQIEQARPISALNPVRGFLRLLADGPMRLLVFQAFLFMGIFVTIYNYAGFRLEEPPFNFSQAQIGLIFSLYLLGSLSSAAAGRLSEAFGREPVYLAALVVLLVGVIVTLTSSTVGFIIGVALVTLGFFGAHSLASAWVGARSALLGGGGAALYLFFYYCGASLLSALGGLPWEQGGWSAVVAYALSLGGLVLLIALRLVWTGRRERDAAMSIPSEIPPA